MARTITEIEAEKIRKKWASLYQQMFEGEAPSAAQFQAAVAHDLIDLASMVRDLAKVATNGE